MTRSTSGVIAAVCFLTLMFAAGLALITDDNEVVPPVQPTPQVVRVEVPGPQPTPQIITKTIEVTPPACIEAINGLSAVLGAENDMLMRYYEGKQPTDAQWDTFLATDPDATYDAMQRCLASTSAGIGS